MPQTLFENIDWVGFVDWNVRDFHGYMTKRGSSYNSYLIRDEKTVLVDSVKAPYADKLVKNIESLTSLDKIDYIICNHAEPDHSGSIPHMVKLCPQAKVITNAKCQSFLSMHYDTEGWNWHIVDEGDEISFGKYTATFINTPMAHWPESMMTYIKEPKLLFSMDAFGQHFASSGRFDDEVPAGHLYAEAKTYYANIITPYGKQVLKALEKASKLDIEMVAPSHGVIWRKGIADVIKWYTDWASYKPFKKVVIFYDSMWQSTDRMAHAVTEGALEVPGVEVRLFDVKSSDITQLATEVMDASAVACGSPTLNMTLMPLMAQALTYIKGLAPKNKLSFAFGSYGWAKKSGPHDVLDYLQQCKWDLLEEEPIQCQFKPTEEVFERLREAGKKLAEHAAQFDPVLDV